MAWRRRQALSSLFSNCESQMPSSDRICQKILLDNGTLLVAENDKLVEIHTFYAHLFSSSGNSSATSFACSHTFRKTHDRLIDIQKRTLNRPPTLKEIKETLDSFPRNKWPRIDSLTIEVYKCFWAFISNDLFAFVLSFWSTCSLPDKVKEGVIKPVPKKPNKQWLANWRPLTMLTTLYKLLAKLAANRLKPLLPQLISHQQTGFVSRWNILENISIAWVTRDWIIHTKTPALFIQLDFEKAFDRIEHSYIWETLERLDLGSTFLELVKAWILDVSSKVHVNGLFIEDILVTRGVRQGYPLSPFLFSLATQPLMEHLQDLLDTRNLQGL